MTLLTGKLQQGLSTKDAAESVGSQTLVVPRILCLTWIADNEAADDQTVAIITFQIYFCSISKPS